MADTFKVTEIKLKPYEPKVIRLFQPGTIPPRPEWMLGESGYVEQVFRTCPTCGGMDIWRGPWAHFPAISYVLVRLETPIQHSGRKRNCACNKCGRFWDDIQMIPYHKQEESDQWWEDDK